MPEPSYAPSSVFDPQPVLEGRLISLRPLAHADYEALFQVASDPLVWEQHPSRLRYQREVFDEQLFRPGLSSGGALVAVDQQTREIIGSSRYYEIEPANRELAIGYTFLARSHWGGQVNGEMKKLMLDHAFSWANKVWFHVGTHNMRSRKAMEKIGAKLSHIAPRTFSGKPVDHCFFCITREDWTNR